MLEEMRIPDCLPSRVAAFLPKNPGFRRPPALARKGWARARLCAAAESIEPVHFSGEPFGRRDIQFQYPQIRVEAPPPRDEVRNFLRIFNPLAAALLPRIGAVRLEEALQQSWILAFFQEDDEDRAGRGVALGEHRPEASFPLRLANQRSGEHRCGDSRTGHPPE